MSGETVIVVPDTVAPVETTSVVIETAALENAVEEVTEKVDALIQHEISDDKQLVISALGEFRQEFSEKFDRLFTLVGDIAAATVVIEEETIANDIVPIDDSEIVTEAIQEESVVVEEVQERSKKKRGYFI